MFHLPYELQCIIMSFLPNDNLHPVSKESQLFYSSNVVWKPRVLQRFGEIPSTNYFKEYCWQLQLERHQFCYKRQWTLGCVGRITPLVKPEQMPAVI